MYDVLIIGAGPAGMTAAVYASRAGYSTALFEANSPGGQAATTDIIDNYPGFPEGVTGPELAMNMFSQVSKFDVDFKFERITEVDFTGETKKVATAQGEYEARAVIIASGAFPRGLGVKGEGRLRGRGVSYCATCDGFFFKDRDVVVVGGGESAAQEALYLSKICSRVTMIHRRDSLRAGKTAQERISKAENIEIIWDTIVREIRGDDTVDGLELENVKTGEKKEMETSAVFIFVGYLPSTNYLKDKVELDEYGYVLTERNGSTNVSGVFAAGDVCKKDLRQVATAVGDGAAVVHAVDEYLKEGK